MVSSNKTWNAEDDRRHPAGQCLEVPTSGVVIERAGTGIEHGGGVNVASFNNKIIDDDDLQYTISICGGVHEADRTHTAQIGEMKQL